MNVTYMDHMGSDLTVVNAARVSFDKESEWLESKNGDYWSNSVTLQEGDRKLINYLAEHHHWLPFRHPTAMFRCKAPIFVARQAVKHQVGMSWSEVSRRYVTGDPEFYTPEVWRKAASDKKQGSQEESIDKPFFVSNEYEKVIRHASAQYAWLLSRGVAPEQARIVLPQSMYTEWVWTGTLLAWAHFVKQRTEAHAQKEIQDFAKLFIPHLERLYPVSWEALMREYQP
jgi:thymidylate synthase (FAD)